MSLLSAVVFTDSKGCVIISRDYRGEVDLKVYSEKIKSIFEEKIDELPSVLDILHVQAFILRHQDIYSTNFRF
jgi:hypothetical protein